jgi:hypothetical protein
LKPSTRNVFKEDVSFSVYQVVSVSLQYDDLPSESGATYQHADGFLKDAEHLEIRMGCSIEENSDCVEGR